MSFIKMVEIGDELIFDLRGKKEEAKEISVFFVRRGGKMVVLDIRADFSIKVKQYKQQTIPEQNFQKIG